MSTSLMLNPGSGPVEGTTTEAQARANMETFVADATARHGAPVTLNPTPTGHSDGRWFFDVTAPDGTTVHEVEMPGLPLDQVRYMREPDQDPFDFPRLWVNGSSWLWFFALGIVRTPDTED